MEEFYLRFRTSFNLKRQLPLARVALVVTDLVLSVLRILRRDLSRLASSIELVELYNKG